jgi:hypothetical protein
VILASSAPLILRLPPLYFISGSVPGYPWTSTEEEEGDKGLSHLQQSTTTFLHKLPNTQADN